jgi:translation initiation factor 2 beta subunit (eIF-2beta)/eIF-5
MEPIRGKVEIIDPSYRYNMEKIIFQKEKTKSCICNLDKIALNLKIDQNHIIAYFKKRLSISITVKNNRVIISNDIDTHLVKNALYEFIDYFILCKKCKLPELTYVMHKKHLSGSCCGCGAINIIDNNVHTEKVIKNIEMALVASRCHSASATSTTSTSPPTSSASTSISASAHCNNMESCQVPLSYERSILSLSKNPIGYNIASIISNDNNKQIKDGE